MGEALDAFIKVAFNYYELDALTASYIYDNKASEKLLKKFNFEITDFIENVITKNNRKFDLVKCYRASVL